MNYKDAKAAIIKQTRRKILHAFNLAHIHGTTSVELSGETLYGIFPEVDADYLRSDVRYLIDKGYLRRINGRNNQPFEEQDFELTAQGKELADAIHRDAALEP